MPNFQPQNWDYETEILVVGGGNAGLPAAIVAHDSGSRVLIAEANSFLGGLMRGSGGFMFFCCSHIQQNLGIEDRIEWGIEDELMMSDFRAVPEIVRAYVQEGSATCHWLEELKLVWANEVRDGEFGTGIHRDRQVARTHFAAISPTGYYPGGFPEGQSGYALTVVLEKAIEQRNIPVLLDHRVCRLFRNLDHAVIGVEAVTPTGAVTIRAHKAVILASGGATSNERLIKAWDPRLVNDAVYSDGLPYMRCMGDALLMAQDVGGGLSDMSFTCFTALKYGTHWYSLSLSAIAGTQGISRMTGVPISAKLGAYQRIILVANGGKRYINEAEAGYQNTKLLRDVTGLPPAEYPEEPFLRAFLALPNPKNVWAITDSQGAGAMKWPVTEIISPDPMRGHGLHPDSVAWANNIEDLATRIHIAPSALATTVSVYNKYAEEGQDREFGKPSPLYPIARPPMYAVKFNLIRHTPAGGIRINAKGQVLDRSELWDGLQPIDLHNERVIPGLYAVGECAAFVGFRRSHRKTGPIISMGRIAGRAAASETYR